jgi:hypothetical protein
MKPKTYQDGFISGQWHATERLMQQVNSFVGPIRRTDFYALLMAYRPTPDDLNNLSGDL